MRAKPFILVTSTAATLAALSACTCNGCPSDDESLPPTMNEAGETGDTGDAAASLCPLGPDARARPVDSDTTHR